jgi:hypothetical protein
MNSTEFNYCVPPSRWNICNQARAARDEANAVTPAVFGFHIDGTKSNAFLHSYWHARMTQRMSFNPATAIGFGQRHEAGQSGNNSAMDLHNNPVGANVGAAFHAAADAQSILTNSANNAFYWGGYPDPAPADKLWYLIK